MTGTVKAVLFFSSTAALLVLGGCGARTSEAGGPRGSYTTPGQQPPATRAAISNELHDAEMAFVDGDWNRVVTHASAVMNADATKEQFYMAKKLLGLVGCNRRDSRLIKDAWELMSDTDRASMRRQCTANGLAVGPDGSVGITPPQ